MPGGNPPRINYSRTGTTLSSEEYRAVLGIDFKAERDKDVFGDCPVKGTCVIMASSFTERNAYLKVCQDNHRLKAHISHSGSMIYNFWSR